LCRSATDYPAAVLLKPTWQVEQHHYPARIVVVKRKIQFVGHLQQQQKYSAVWLEFT
jgi:hypothetical protein